MNEFQFYFKIFLIIYIVQAIAIYKEDLKNLFTMLWLILYFDPERQVSISDHISQLLQYTKMQGSPNSTAIGNL